MNTILENSFLNLSCASNRCLLKFEKYLTLLENIVGSLNPKMLEIFKNL